SDWGGRIRGRRSGVRSVTPYGGSSTCAGSFPGFASLTRGYGTAARFAGWSTPPWRGSLRTAMRANSYALSADGFAHRYRSLSLIPLCERIRAVILRVHSQSGNAHDADANANRSTGKW